MLRANYFVAGVLIALAVTPASAQTGDTTRTVVLTLLLSAAATTDPSAQREQNLTVAAAGNNEFPEAKSWLYFDASALPANIKESDFTDVELELTPKEGAANGMAITVAPAKEKSAGPLNPPEAYSPEAGRESTRLVSPPLPKEKTMLELRSDYASLERGNLLVESGQRRYIGLLLLPQGNTSRRVYYGLNGAHHPGRVPRLIITYNRKVPAVPPCASEPSRLATIQSESRPGAASPCDFVPRADNHPSSNYSLRPYRVATDTRTQAQVAYGDRLYVVHKSSSKTTLDELRPLGGLIASVTLNGEVRPGSPMVVDAFGRLRILTNDAIFTAQLQPESPNGRDLPAIVDKKSFAFGQTPRLVVPGPDGTLYIVDQGIYALNPDVGELDKDGKVVHPQELWNVGIDDENSAKITLSPDGHFLYALARVAGVKKSEVIAVNAQTGKDVALLPDKAGKPFPGDLSSFRNPVVVRGLKGVDFIYITGNSGSASILWGVRNDPVKQSGDYLAQLTRAWDHPLGPNSVVGQPILDPIAPSGNDGLRNKRLYFLHKLAGTAGTTKFTAVSALDGAPVAETSEPTGSPDKWSTESNLVVDSAGNVMFYGGHSLYGFTAEGKSLFAPSVQSPSSRLSFGPGGTLYATEQTADTGSNVIALIPSFQQKEAGPADVYSPTQLSMTGDPAGKVGKSGVLGSRGDVMLGEDFSVKVGETLTIRVNTGK